MPVFKIEKNNNYTVMSNYHLRDNNLSYKAKGLLSFMLSLPEDWDYSLNGLVKISKENRDAIRSILKELQDNHYLKIEKLRGNKGYFEYNYLIYEKPHIIDQENVDNNPYMDSPNVEEQLQLNTNIINTKEQIDKDDKPISPFFVAEEHNILTLELINRKYIDGNDTQIFYYDAFFEELLSNNNTYKDLIKIIHYIVPRVIMNCFKDENGNKIENKFGYFKNSIINNINKLKFLDNLYLDDLWNEYDI